MNLLEKKRIHISFTNGLPWMLISLGIMSVLIGYYAFNDETKFSRLLVTIGGATLSGGVFAVILKSFQFIGIFKEELSKIIYEHEYISRLSGAARKELWKKITSSIHNDNFPDLNERIHNGIIENYFPTDKKYYFKKYKRLCKVGWDDSISRTVISAEEVSVEIVARSKHEPINHTFTYTATIEKDSFITNIDLNYLEIDGSDFSSEMNCERVEEGGLTKIKYHYNIPLQGKKKYVLKRKITKTFALSVDPYSRYYSETFILGSSVKVEVETKGLGVQFVESGTIKQFENRWDGKLSDCGSLSSTIEKDYSDLLFPNQGYVLYYECEQS